MTEDAEYEQVAPEEGATDDGAGVGSYGVFGAATLLVAECVGTGVLALPGDAHRLGLAAYLVVLGLNGIFNVSAGSLLNDAARGTRARDFVELAWILEPRRTSLHDAIVAAWYVNLFLVLGQYVLVMSRGLELALGASSCSPLSSFAAASCALALGQMSRTMASLHGPSLLSIGSVLAILVACVASIQPSPLPASRLDANFLEGSAAISSIVFAAGTQKLLLNVRKEQRHPSSETMPALAVAIFAFFAIYVVVVLLAGPTPPGFLLDALLEKPSVIRRTAGILLFCHVLVSYAINLQPLAKSIERVLFASTNKEAATSPQRWFGLTFAITATAWLVANAVPFFSDLVSLVGALASAPLAFAIPAVLYLHSPAGTKHRRREAYFHCGLTFAVQVVGTVGSVHSIVRHWEHYTIPFNCHSGTRAS